MQKLSPTLSAELVDSLGGTKHIAGIFQLTQSAVSYWKSRGMPLPYVQYLSVQYRANPIFKRQEVMAFLGKK